MHELAEKTGLTQAAISRYESTDPTKKREPKWIDVQKIAKALNLPCSEFLEVVAPPEAAKGRTGASAAKPKRKPRK